MANRTFADFIPRIQPHILACPQETIRQNIRNAAIRACEWTQIWKYEVRSFNLVAGMHEYAYSKPAGTEVHTLYAAILDKAYPLDILTLDQAIERFPAWADLMGGLDPMSAWSLTPPSEFNIDEFNAATYGANPAFVTPPEALVGTSTPSAITHLSQDKFIVLPSPDVTYSLRIFTALRPSRTADSMDEAVANELEDVIFHRVLQDVMSMPNTPWTNLELAAYHARQYIFLVNERRARSNLTAARGKVRVQQPFFE
jgi:hypothetical protein